MAASPAGVITKAEHETLQAFGSHLNDLRLQMDRQMALWDQGYRLNEESVLRAIRLGKIQLQNSALMVGTLLSPLPWGPTSWAVKRFGHLIDPVWPEKLKSPKFWGENARAAFFKQFRDPNYQPTIGELADLNSQGLLPVFEKRQAFFKANPRRALLNRAVISSKEIAVGAAYVAAMTHIAMMAGGDTVDFKESGNEFLQELPDDQIQLILDLAPLPHLSIRIRDRVFWYGVRQVQALETIDYFDKDAIQRRNQEYTENAQLQKGSFDEFKAGMAKKLAQYPHSAQIVTLKVSPAEVNELQRFLEFQVGKLYRNITMVNDCATMTIRALKRVTSVQDIFLRAVDASPSQVLMYFSNLKALGDSRVLSVKTLITEGANRRAFHFFRNAYVNIVESRFFMVQWEFLQIQRLMVDGRFSEDELSAFHAATEKELAELRLEASKLMEFNAVVVQHFSTWPRLTPAGQRSSLEQILSQVDSEISVRERQLLSPQLDLVTYTRLAAESEALKIRRDEFRVQLKQL